MENRLRPRAYGRPSVGSLCSGIPQIITAVPSENKLGSKEGLSASVLALVLTESVLGSGNK